MDFSKSLLLIVSISSLLLSGHALAPSAAPSKAAKELGPGSLFQTLFKVPTLEVFKPGPEVIQFCTGTENPALCAETIAPYHKGSFDPIKALETEMEFTLNQSLKVAAAIHEKLHSHQTVKAMSEALDVCKKNYGNIVDTVKEALELLQQHNVVDAYYKFNCVLSDRSSCEEAFVESGIINPFVEESMTLYQLGGNCMAIMDGLVNNHNQFLV